MEHLKKKRKFCQQFFNFAIYFILLSNTINIMKLARSNEIKSITFTALYNIIRDYICIYDLFAF